MQTFSRSIRRLAASLPTRPFIILALLLSSACSQATVVAVIETNDGYWIAADGLRGTNSVRADSACKIHATKFGIVAKAGATQGFSETGTDYSVDRELFNIINNAKSIEYLKFSLREKYTQDIWGQISYLLGQNGKDYSSVRTIQGTLFNSAIPEEMIDSESRQVVLISVEDNQLTMRQLIVSPASRKISGLNYQYFVRVVDWLKIDRTTLRREDQSHPSLHQFALPVKVYESDEWIREHPEKTLRMILHEGTSAYPKKVGRPYAIAHVTLSAKRVKGATGLAINWIESGKCPSWNFKTYNEDDLKKNDVRH